jgi:hypothetical protein
MISAQPSIVNLFRGGRRQFCLLETPAHPEHGEKEGEMKCPAAEVLETMIFNSPRIVEWNRCSLLSLII